jgi:hypothetical protein
MNTNKSRIPVTSVKFGIAGYRKLKISVRTLCESARHVFISMVIQVLITLFVCVTSITMGRVAQSV